MQYLSKQVYFSWFSIEKQPSYQRHHVNDPVVLHTFRFCLLLS